MPANPDALVTALDYPPPPGHDEAHLPGGGLRPHWEYLLRGLDGLGAQELDARVAKARRILRDDGATYHVHGRPAGHGQAWRLDPVPLLVESDAWARIEEGLQERAELLDLVLQDLYGPRELIARGVLPPELLHGHPGFLRACDGIRLPGARQLVLHAADLVRDSDDAVVVLGDRCQVPSGAGYALENRTVMSRVLPSLFRDSHVHRLALFFMTLRATLQQLAPQGDDDPQVVILTPGPFSETYFEQAYLANYLGYHLVRGEDLSVRDGRVVMRTVDGLQRVDVILRRVDDWFCDPVELKGDSQLGVPGLVEAARSGRVAIVNPLGAGLLEHPALLKYLPAVGRHFLGREPQLRSVTTWWCGDEADRDHVLANLERLVIRTVFRRRGMPSRFGSQLDSAEADALRAAIARHPHRYAAQEPLVPSTSPIWRDRSLQPAETVLRSFSVAADGSYAVLPGGLTRVGSDAATRRVSSQAGSLSKDTWVLSSEPEKEVSLLSRTGAALAQPLGVFNLPSRTVENLFWLGRYAERAEANIRLLRIVFVQLNRKSGLPDSVTAHRHLLDTVGHLTGAYPGFHAPADGPLPEPDEELLAQLLDAARSGSVTANLRSLLNAAEAVQDQLSADTQRVVNDLSDELDALGEAFADGLGAAPDEALDPLVTVLMAFAGLAQESMIRGTGWRFLEIGRRLERILMTVALLRGTLFEAGPADDEALLLESVLLSVENLITYRRRYRARLSVDSTLELLMHDPSNPRSLRYQLDQLQLQVARLPGMGGMLPTAEEKLVIESTALLRLAEPHRLAAVDEASRLRPALAEALDRLHGLVSTLASAISDRYFDHTVQPQQLVNASWEDES